jgi:Flp pilus assembly protein TadD
VLNNLCYTAVLEGDASRAVARCRAALDVDPNLKTTRNNLALAYAAAGDFTSASREFRVSGDATAERYNMGVALFATGHYQEAAAAFDEAAALRPSLTLARQRAQQARDLAAGTP